MFKPNRGTIFVKKIEDKEGIIIIPDVSEDKEPIMGEVTAVCDNFVENGVLVEQFLKPGDKVIFNPMRAVKFEVNNEKFIMVYMNQILAYEQTGA